MTGQEQYEAVCAQWNHAKSLEEMGEFTAAFLEGRLPYTPSHLGGPDAETGPLVATLAAINRAGFITDCSQPGQAMNDKGSAQRAFLTGFASWHTAGILSCALVEQDLVVLTFPPGKGGDGQLVVTLDEGNEFTWCGLHSAAWVDSYVAAGCPNIAPLLEKAWTLQIIDPVWNRNDVIWEAVRSALVESARWR